VYEVYDEKYPDPFVFFLNFVVKINGGQANRITML
jgi:hypothetical protein